MSESRRVQSIARRVSRGFLLRLVVSVLLVNLFLAVNALGWTVYSVEKAALGARWQADLARKISVDETLRGRAWLNSVTYSFSLPGGEPYRVTAGPILETIALAHNGLLLGEALLVFFQYRGFRRRALYLLDPLRQMARTAEELSSLRLDEQKFHSLEDAIASLSVQSPGARLATGHSELTGLETAINKLIERMHESYRQQNRFVSDASHELRTPIAVIRGYADLLSRWGKDDRKVMDESVEAIKDEADNMQRLVEQLLFLARGDAGRMAFTPQRVDLAQLAKEAHEEYTLIAPGHAWRLRAEEPVYARGDEAMLKQALRVLADNAIKFSPEHSPITLRALYDGKGQACLSVQDNGSGISPENLPHIFERFYRADPARARGGSGLGLSIAQFIAQRHQGHMDVTSVEGLGTRFTLSLPPDTAGEAQAPEEEKAPAAAP